MLGVLSSLSLSSYAKKIQATFTSAIPEHLDNITMEGKGNGRAEEFRLRRERGPEKRNRSTMEVCYGNEHSIKREAMFRTRPEVSRVYTGSVNFIEEGPTICPYFPIFLTVNIITFKFTILSSRINYSFVAGTKGLLRF